MAKEHQRVLKYAGNSEGRCPACNSKMDYHAMSGAMPPRFYCICGYSIFNFKMLHVNWDMLPTR